MKSWIIRIKKNEIEYFYNALDGLFLYFYKVLYGNNKRVQKKKAN